MSGESEGELGDGEEDTRVRSSMMMDVRPELER
jgi:hypothetical protein